jgi:hypothetical protein
MSHGYKLAESTSISLRKFEHVVREENIFGKCYCRFMREGKIFGKYYCGLREKGKYLENVILGCERRKNIWKTLL